MQGLRSPVSDGGAYEWPMAGGNAWSRWGDAGELAALAPASDAPWQERLLVFVLLCVLTAWLCHIALRFRELLLAAEADELPPPSPPPCRRRHE